MTKRQPRPRSIALFRDIADVFDTVLAKGVFPAEVRLPSPKQAIKWAHRAHTFRSILREQEEHAQGLSPGTGSSIYDPFLLQVDGEIVKVSLRDSTVRLLVGGEEVAITSVQDYEKEFGLDDPAIE